MNPNDITQQDIQNYFSNSDIYKRGLSYYKNGAVRNLRYSTNSLSSDVKGSYGGYKISVTFLDGNVKSKCSCPYDVKSPKNQTNKLDR